MTTEKIELTETPIEPAKKKTPTKSTEATSKITTAKKDTTPKKPRQKKLTLKSLQAMEADVHTLSTHVINKETNEVIKYYKIFDESKIQMLLTEALEKMQYAKANEIEFFMEDSELYTFISYLTIKHFTHLGEELENSTLEDDIAALSTLLSTGLFKTILNDIFDGNEVMKILDTMHEHIEMSARAIQMEEQMKQEALNSVQSPVIKKKMEENSSYRNVLN